MPTLQRAAAVRLAYAADQLQVARPAWHTPDVIAFRAWLEREAFRALDAGRPIPRPLRPPEEWLLWREGAQEATQGSEWAPSDALAEPLRRAGRLMSDWCIPRAALRAAGTHEAELLERALVHVEARCRANGSAASHQLGALLRSWTPPRVPAFEGFAEFTAAQRALIECWADPAASQPTELKREDRVEEAPGTTYHSSARDPVGELELAAEWCRSRLSADARARLLVLIPDLAERRAEALRVFAEILDPRSALDGADAGVAVEGGLPLSGYPLVRHALTALKFLTGALEFDAFSAWLRASFWRAPREAERAQLDRWLRRVLQIEVTPLELTAALSSAADGLGSAAKALEAAVSAAARALGPGNEHAAIPQWVRRWDEALRALGWPGERRLASAEHQTLTRFAELLSDCVALGRSFGKISAREATQLLETLAERAAFAPATGDAAVTLTSALVDPVVRYDGIWVAGLHADAWPPPASIDPFVPLGAQRRAGIPWATPLGSLQRARRLLGRWRRATPELILSWPLSSGDRDCLASPLLAELADPQPWTLAERRPRLAQHIRRGRQLEWFEDAAGDPWPARMPLPGGARALEYQARCPFRAYAELRLSAAALEAPRPGIEPRERGRLLHRALELLWGRLRDSRGLELADRSGTLGRLIEECVSQAGREVWVAPRSTQPPAQGARGREEARAVRLLAQLAALERGRPPFRVSALELARRLELAGAALDLRIDRIDEFPDGSRAIFDYKSGRPSSPDWFADRLTDPQLPAYLLAAGEDVVALATIHLAAEGVTYRGVSDREGRLPRSGLHEAPREVWQEQVERWRTALERLAGAFLAGEAAVDPVENACRVCHLQAFCRIGEVELPQPGASSGDTSDAEPA